MDTADEIAEIAKKAASPEFAQAIERFMEAVRKFGDVVGSVVRADREESD